MKNGIALIALAGAGLAYFFYKKNQSANPSMPLSNPSGYTPAQPSQMYPWTPAVGPRVDNANQPWYNGLMNFAGNEQSTMQGFAKDVGAAGSIVHSVSDIWGTLGLGGMFGSSDSPQANLVATDDWFSESEYDLMGGYGEDNSWDVSDADWEYENEWA